MKAGGLGDYGGKRAKTDEREDKRRGGGWSNTLNGAEDKFRGEEKGGRTVGGLWRWGKEETREGRGRRGSALTGYNDKELTKRGQGSAGGSQRGHKESWVGRRTAG